MKATAEESATLKQELKHKPWTADLIAEAVAHPEEAGEAVQEVQDGFDTADDGSWVALVNDGALTIVKTTCRHCGNAIGQRPDPSGQRGDAAWSEMNWADDRDFQCGLNPESNRHEPEPPATDAITPTTTHDDGTFIRTAIVIEPGAENEGSIAIVLPDGTRLALLNIFVYEDGKQVIVDVVDTDERYEERTALTFADNLRQSLPAAKVVSANFRGLKTGGTGNTE